MMAYFGLTQNSEQSLSTRLRYLSQVPIYGTNSSSRTYSGVSIPRQRISFESLRLLRPGDWIYHVNHSYGDIEHSGMFVDWLDRKRHIALMLSYGGEGRRKPGRYRPYDITHTYRIIRPTGAK